MPRRFPRRTRAALALVAILSILPIVPAAVHALPLDFEPRSAVRLEAGDWLSRLGQAVRTLWTKATAETGMTIDPNGRPDAQPGDPASDPDTGMSIDPNG